MGKHTLDEPEPVISGTWTEEEMQDFGHGGENK